MEQKASQDSTRKQPARSTKKSISYSELIREQAAPTSGGGDSSRSTASMVNPEDSTSSEDKQASLGAAATVNTPLLTSQQSPPTGTSEMQLMMTFMQSQTQVMQEMMKLMTDLKQNLTVQQIPVNQPASSASLLSPFPAPVSVPSPAAPGAPLTEVKINDVLISATAGNMQTEILGLSSSQTNTSTDGNLPGTSSDKRQSPAVNVKECKELTPETFKHANVKGLDDEALFDIWGELFRSAMKVARTWGYFDGTITWDKTDPVQLDLYRSNSYICFDFLIHRLPLPISGRLTQYEGEDNPAQLSWSYLKNNYSQKGVQRTFNLSTQLHDIKMKRNETAIAYINRGIELRTLLKIAGKVMPDSEWIRCINKGLPDHYRTVQQQLVLRPEMAEEDFIRLVKHAAEDSPDAPSTHTHLLNSVTSLPEQQEQQEFHVDLGAVQARGRKDWSVRSCYCCKEKGHSWRTCPNRDKFPNWKPPGDNNPNWQGNGNPQRHFNNAVRQLNLNAVTVTQHNSTVRPSVIPDQPPAHYVISTDSTDNQSMIQVNVVAVQDTGPAWIVDTGADRHITGSTQWFQQFTPLTNTVICRMSNGTLSPAIGKGVIRFKSNDPPHVTFDVHDVLLVPGVTANLLSGNRLRKGGAYLHSDEKGWWLETRHKQLLALASSHSDSDQVFLNVKPVLPDKPPPITNSFSDTHAVNTGTWQQWHYRLGHPHAASISWRPGYRMEDHREGGPSSMPWLQGSSTSKAPILSISEYGHTATRDSTCRSSVLSPVIRWKALHASAGRPLQ